MGTYDIIKMLCEKRGTNITSLEQALGFSRGSIGKLRTAHKAMNTDRLKQSPGGWAIRTHGSQRRYTSI